MISMSSNAPELVAKMTAQAKALDKAIEAATKKTANDVKRTAMMTTPVRTGVLRRNWNMNEEGKWEYEVSNEVEYAIYVEHGTWKMAGRHMLGNAVHIHEPQLKLAVMAAMKVIM